jgi:hypothetical protein
MSEEGRVPRGLCRPRMVGAGGRNELDDVVFADRCREPEDLAREGCDFGRLSRENVESEAPPDNVKFSDALTCHRRFAATVAGDG